MKIRSFPLSALLASVLAAFLAGCAADAERAGAAAAIDETLARAAAASEEQGDYSGAVNHYTTLFKRQPDNFDATLGLARNLRYVGRAKDAAQILDRVRPKFGDRPAMALEHGKAKIAAGDARTAIGLLTRARDMAPGNWDTHATLGIAYDLIESYDKAQAAYEKARELSKDDPVVLNNMAISAALAGRLDEAIRILEAAPQAARHSPQIRQNLALFYGIKGDMAKAEGLAKMDLDEAAVRDNMAIFARFHAARGRQPRSRK